MKKLKRKTQDTLIIVIANILLLGYIIGIGIVGGNKQWTANILGAKTGLIFMLMIMFVFELLSTITFQLRIWLTSKNKIRIAAIIGATSWLIAGIQGLLLINGSIDGLNEAATFFIKLPPVFIATFSGILINSYFNKKEVEK